jgi:hypothetical protein
MKENENQLFSLQIILVCCLGLFTVLIPLLFLYRKDTGFIGDYGGFMSGVLGTIISLVTVILVYRTFNLQKEELKLQRQELTQTREQLKKQQFETSFFQIMEMLKSEMNNTYFQEQILEREVTFEPKIFKGLEVFNYIKDTVTEKMWDEQTFTRVRILTRLGILYPNEEIFQPVKGDGTFPDNFV